MLLKIYDENPNPKALRQVVDTLKSGGLVIVPTDSVYGICCDINNHKAVSRLAQLKGIDLKKANFSFIFSDLSQVANYTRPLNNNIFKLLKHNLPGPFTFILPAGSEVPTIFKNKKKTLGVRIPNNQIIQAIVAEMGNPLLTTSVRDEDSIIEYTTDPELIHEEWNERVDLVVDGGYGNNIATAIIDCTASEPEIIREGSQEPII